MLDVLKLYYSYFLFDFNVASTHNGHFATTHRDGEADTEKKRPHVSLLISIELPGYFT